MFADASLIPSAYTVVPPTSYQILVQNGVAYPQTFIKNDLLSASLYTKIKEIDYFKQFTYNDILGLIETLQDVRYHIIADEAKTIHAQLGSVKAFKKKNHLPAMLCALVTAMVLGRFVGGAAKALFIAVGVIGSKTPYTFAAFFTSYFVSTAVGALIHIVLIPIVVLALEKAKLSPVANAFK